MNVDVPGRVEGNVFFAYLDTFDEEARATVEELKARYRSGGLGDGAVKKRLNDILQALLAPIRARRADLSKDPAHVLDVIRKGTETARDRTDATKREVVEHLGLFRL